MKKQKSKITPAVELIIRGYADKLPPMVKFNSKGHQVFAPKMVDGAELLANCAKDKHGNDPIPGRKYLANMAVYEDHYTNMTMLFNRGGMEAVERSFIKLMSIQEQKLRTIQEQNAKQNFLTRVMSWIRSRF